MDDGMMQCGIYAITNAVTGRVYIGKTETSFAVRWKTHIADLRLGRHHNVLLQAEWREYGEDAFVFSVVEVITLEGDSSFFLERERYYIELASAELYNWVTLDPTHRSLLLRPHIRTEHIVSRLVDNLFKMYLHPSGREYTYQEVSDGINGELDPTYIGRLRKGGVPNPGRNTLSLLCQFFSVPPAYFFPELAPKQHVPANNQPSIESPLINDIRRAVMDLPIDSKNYLLTFIDFIKEKGLPIW